MQHFVLPDLGEGLADAELVAWHVAVGDEVALNQVLVEVETEKAVVELPSPFVGTVVELLAAAGETVSVGAPLIAIDTDADTETGSADTAPRPTPAAVAEEKVPMLVGYGPSEAPPSRRRRNGSGHRERVPVETPPTPPTPARTARSPRHPCASWPARTASTWRT